MNNEEIQEILDESEQTEFFYEEDMLVGPAGPQGEPGKSGNDVKVYPTQPSTGENVWIQKSKNRFNKNSKIIEGYYIDNSGSMIVSTGAWYQEEYIPIESNTAFTISSEVAILRAIFYDKNYNFISRVTTTETVLSFTTPENCKYLRVSGNSSSTQLASLQLEPGAKRTTYEAFIKPEIYTKNSNGNYEKLTDSLEVSYYQPKSNQNIWFKNNINILNTKDIISTKFNGVTITANADGTVTFNGTCTQSGNLVLIEDLNKIINGKYTFYLKVVNEGTLTGSNCRISINDSTNSSASDSKSRIFSFVWNSNTTENSITGIIDNKKIYYLSIYINKDCTYTNCKVRLQLEQGEKQNKTNNDYVEETSNEIYFKNSSGNYEKFSDTIEVKDTKPLNNNKIWFKETNNLFDYKRAKYLNAYFNTENSDIRNSLSEDFYMTYVRCKPNTTYTITKMAGKSFTLATTTVEPKIGVKYNLKWTNHAATSQTITTGPNDNYLGMICYAPNYDDTSITYLDMYATVQVEEGMIATNYSKNTDNGFYTKNKSGKYNKFSESVSIDSLEPINNAGVWFKKGKNLIDYSKLTWWRDINDKGIITYYDDRAVISDYTPVNPNTSYIFSHALGTALGKIYIFDKNKNYIGYINHDNITSAFTTNENTYYVRAWVWYSVGTITPEIETWMQLEQGTVATSYEPHIEKEILTKNANGEFESFIKEEKETYVGTLPVNNEIWFKKGKNLINKIIYGESFNEKTNSMNISRNWARTDFIEIELNVPYIFSHQLNIANGKISTFDKNYNWLEDINKEAILNSFIITNSNVKYVMVNAWFPEEITSTNESWMQLEQNLVATSNEAYIEKEILVKNSNGVYEKFIKKEEIKYISNENGIAIKFPDGTLIQYGSYVVPQIQANSGYNKSVILPVNFIDTNYVLTVTKMSAGTLGFADVGDATARDSQSQISFVHWNNSNITVASFIAGWTTIGKWK